MADSTANVSIGQHPMLVAGVATLIWIFVQTMLIPFSVQQAVYVDAGLAELGLVLLGLGVLRPSCRSAQTPRS
jgi:hypothetical protein